MAHGGEEWHRGLMVPKGRFEKPGRFGRKFPHLRSLKSFTPEDADVLGAAGTPEAPGPMNGADVLENDGIPAGFTFLGQFIDHDLTLDTTSSLERQNDPEAIRNFRTPAFELDSLYGLGPAVQPYLYDADDRDLFLIPDDGVDLPRNIDDVALIGDPRNDENLIINQLHLAFLKFHNAVRRMPHVGSFEDAQTLVRWHYQWIVLNEFLRKTAGDAAVDAALARPAPDGYREEAFMPVEFSVAAYRFGHSQVRPGYPINDGFGAGFFPADPTAPKPSKEQRSDLRGGVVGPAFTVDWSRFFGDEPNVTRSLLIDTKLSPPLLNLPLTVVGPANSGGPPRVGSLASRNLKRGITFSLPAGETIAEFYGITPLTRDEVGDHPGMADGTPLWFYILKEAELAGGHSLAGVGARIVAEVFVDLLRMDSASFLGSRPGWTPTLPSAAPGNFLMADLIRIAIA